MLFIIMNVRLILGNVFLYFIFYINTIYSKSIEIPLYRQKTPREAAININNINGFYTDWLKPNPPKPPAKNDSIALFRFLDSEFYGIVKIGYKARPFNIIFDTTWGHSWVFSSDCSYTVVGCWFHNKYDHTQSSTYVANGTKFNVDFKTYNISGYLSEDVFHFDHLNVTNQTFAEIMNVPYTYLFSRADGIIGLGYSSLSYGVNPVFYNLIKQKKLDLPIFSVYLNRDPSSNRGGNLILGNITERHIAKNHSITYLPVNQTGYWQFKMDMIIMQDGKKSYPFCNDGCQAIADTGSTNILGPNVEVNKIHRLIKAKYLGFNMYQVNCETINKLPDIIFVLAGKEFKISGRDYTKKLSYKFVTICLSAFVPRNDFNQDVWVLGGAFLAEYYSIYDFGKNLIGFVKSA